VTVGYVAVDPRTVDPRSGVQCFAGLTPDEFHCEEPGDAGGAPVTQILDLPASGSVTMPIAIP
jgi:hypothetical protein